MNPTRGESPINALASAHLSAHTNAAPAGLILTVGALLGAVLVWCTVRLQEEMEHWSDKIRSDVGELRQEVPELAQGVQVIRAAMGISDKDFEAALEEVLSGVPEPGPDPTEQAPASGLRTSSNSLA